MTLKNNLKEHNELYKLANLSEVIRPKNISELVGQNHLLSKNKILSAIIASQKIPSLILSGPSGTGKTTIAKLIIDNFQGKTYSLSALNSTSAELKKIFDEARLTLNKPVNNSVDLFSEKKHNDPLVNLSSNKPILLFIDEFHHFNKTQQDLFLNVIEEGLIILIATTTQNPSFALNSALISRCQILQLNLLDEDDLEKIIQRVEDKISYKLLLTPDARKYLISLACGDARYLINACEQILSYQEYFKNDSLSHNQFQISEQERMMINEDQLKQIIAKRSAHFDNKGDMHYNLISAFHKSLRGSDVNSALYYLARMLIAKQDIHYIFRRLARFATEDIGMADPQALVQVMNSIENYNFLGSPEGDYALSHATIYCACAPKSNASYLAHQSAIEMANSSTNLNPPFYICDSSYVKLSKKNLQKNQLATNVSRVINYKNYDESLQNYIYDHDTKECFSGQEYMPEELRNKMLLQPENLCFYQPSNRGFEKDLHKRIKYWQALKAKINE